MHLKYQYIKPVRVQKYEEFTDDKIYLKLKELPII